MGDIIDEMAPEFDRAPYRDGRASARATLGQLRAWAEEHGDDATLEKLDQLEDSLERLAERTEYLAFFKHLAAKQDAPNA